MSQFAIAAHYIMYEVTCAATVQLLKLTITLLALALLAVTVTGTGWDNCSIAAAHKDDSQLCLHSAVLSIIR